MSGGLCKKAVVLMTSYLPCWWARDSSLGLMRCPNTTPALGSLDGQQFMSHIDSCPGGGRCLVIREIIPVLHSGAGWMRLQEASFVTPGRWAPLVPTGGCDWLVWIIVWLAGKWNPLLKDRRELHLDLLTRKVVWLSYLLCRSGVRRGTCGEAIGGHANLTRP